MRACRIHGPLRTFALPRAAQLRYSFLEGALWTVLPFVCSATCRSHAALARSTAPFAKGRPTSVSAPTASITARIAGKPATLRWLRAVATEAKNLHMCIDADARLAAAAGGVARFLADAAGLESDAVARLQSAVIKACLEAFEHLAGKHPHLEIDFARLSDRLAVSLSHEAARSAVGVEPTTGSSPTRRAHLVIAQRHAQRHAVPRGYDFCLVQQVREVRVFFLRLISLIEKPCLEQLAQCVRIFHRTANSLELSINAAAGVHVDNQVLHARNQLRGLGKLLDFRRKLLHG